MYDAVSEVTITQSQLLPWPSENSGGSINLRFLSFLFWSVHAHNDLSLCEVNVFLRQNSGPQVINTLFMHLETDLGNGGFIG